MLVQKRVKCTGRVNVDTHAARMFGLYKLRDGIKGQVCSSAYELAGHLALTDFHSEDPK